MFLPKFIQPLGLLLWKENQNGVYIEQGFLKWGPEAIKEVWFMHLSAWMESVLLTTYCPNEAI